MCVGGLCVYVCINVHCGSHFTHLFQGTLKNGFARVVESHVLSLLVTLVCIEEPLILYRCYCRN